jgi:hypothetical protein
MSDLLVFTTGADGKLDLTRESCAAVGITLRTFPAPWVGYVTTKLRPAIPFLQSRREPFAMWIDGHDSLVLQPEHEIMRRYTARGASILFSAERDCWPDKDLANMYPEAPDPKYLNAGGFIGLREDLIAAMLNTLAFPNTEDDQRSWVLTYLMGKADIKLDHGRRVFASLGDGDASRDCDSCVKHWNGKVPGREEFWNEWKSHRSTA